MKMEQEHVSKPIAALITQGITAVDIQKLLNAGINNPDELMIRTNLDLADLTGLSCSKLDLIRKAVEDMKMERSFKIEQDTDEISVGERENPFPLVTGESSTKLHRSQLRITPSLSTQPQDERGTTIVGLLFKDGIIFVCDGLARNRKGMKTKDDAFKIAKVKNLRVAKAGSNKQITSILAKFDDEVRKLLPRLSVLETAKELVKIAKTMYKESLITDDKKVDPNDETKKIANDERKDKTPCKLEIKIGGGDFDFEIMIGGYDADNDGVQLPRLYYVNRGGCYPIGTHQSIGGGAIYSQILMNNEYGNDMSQDQALRIAGDSIFHATNHSRTTGGKVQAIVMERDKETRFEFPSPQ